MTGAPSEHPAEAQQDDDPANPAAWREHAAVLLSPEQVRRRDPVDAVAQHLADAYAAGLAARSSADTETLRRVREMAETYAFLGAVLHHVPVAETYAEVAAELRAALDGTQ